MQHLFASGHILEIQPLDAPLAHELVALDSDGVQGSIRRIVPKQLGWYFGMRLWRQGLYQQRSASFLPAKKGLLCPVTIAHVRVHQKCFHPPLTCRNVNTRTGMLGSR